MRLWLAFRLIVLMKRIISGLCLIKNIHQGKSLLFQSVLWTNLKASDRDIDRGELKGSPFFMSGVVIGIFAVFFTVKLRHDSLNCFRRKQLRGVRSLFYLSPVVRH